MRTLTTLALTLLFAGGGILGAQPAADRVIASTNEWSITASQFEAILQALPDQARNFFSGPENRRRFLDDLIEMWVLAAEARNKGIDKESTLKAEVEFYSNNILAREYSRRLATASPAVTEADVESFYKTNPNDFTEVKVAHILIVNNDNPDVQKANIPGALPAAEARKRIEEVRAKMRAGENFTDLAKQYSQDTASAQDGGDIGFIRKGQLMGDVDKTAFALEPGSFSDIVESPIGFHILHVSERKVAAFEEVRDQIRQRLETERRDGNVQSRVKAAGVKIDETFFKN